MTTQEAKIESLEIENKLLKKALSVATKVLEQVKGTNTAVDECISVNKQILK